MKAIELIEAQQKGKEGTPAYMVGEQLKDICRSEPASADLVEKDLAIESMSLAAAAGKIKAHADELHKKQKGNCVCITPDVAERIIREFYGLPSAAEPHPAAPVPEPAAEDSGFLNLDDFL